MSGNMHPFGSYLTGYGNKRCAVAVCICHTGYQVRGTRSQRCQTHTGFSGQSSIDIGHKCRALLMARRNKFDR